MQAIPEHCEREVFSVIYVLFLHCIKSPLSTSPSYYLKWKEVRLLEGYRPHIQKSLHCESSEEVIKHLGKADHPLLWKQGTTIWWLSGGEVEVTGFRASSLRDEPKFLVLMQRNFFLVRGRLCCSNWGTWWLTKRQRYHRELPPGHSGGSLLR